MSSQLLSGASSSKPTPWFEDKSGRFRLYRGDCREILPALSVYGSIPLIFADPPYFLSGGGITCQAGRMVSVDKGEWDKAVGVDQMHEFNREWLEVCRDGLTRDGTIWVSGTRHVIFSVGFAMQQLEMKLLNDICWEKPNPPPNLSCRYFTHSSETVLWAARSKKSKHVCHYKEMRQRAGGKQMKSVWRMTAPRKAEKQFGKHPTQKPIALLDRIISASCNPGDLVVDPFSGSGTTGIAAVALGRKYVGVELEEEYLELSKQRYLELVNQPALPLR